MMYLVFLLLGLLGVLALARGLRALINRIGLRKMSVNQGFAGLLYVDGVYVRELAPGAHWLLTRRSAVILVDLRQRVMTIPGQEVLTRDNVGIKVSLAARFRVSDPARATHEVQDFTAALYQMIQLALREVVGELGATDLISGRVSLGGKLLEAVAEPASLLGVVVATLDVKDAMFPNDLKRSFAQVLVARNEGLAALEKARGESAALRSLANAARLMDTNPNLFKLRMLKTLDDIGAAYGNTLVLGVPDGFGLVTKNDK